MFLLYLLETLLLFDKRIFKEHKRKNVRQKGKKAETGTETETETETEIEIETETETERL